MKNKIIFILVCIFSPVVLIAQENKEKTYYADSLRVTNNIPGDSLFLFTIKQDSIWIRDKVLFFKTSPIVYLKGFEFVVCDDPLVLPKLLTGYTLRWRIIEKGLYIESINTYPTICLCNETDSLGRKQSIDTKPNNVLAKNKLEKFTGRKFGRKGLFADWITGKYVIYKYPNSLDDEKKDFPTIKDSKKYSERLSKMQEVYILELRNGRLVDFRRDRELEIKTREAHVLSAK